MKLLNAAVAALVVLASLSVADATNASVARPAPSVSQSDGKSWGGSAKATCKCKDGVCMPVSCSVEGKATYEDAKKALKAAIEAKIRAENGKLDGEISFSIKIKF